MCLDGSTYRCLHATECAPHILLRCSQLFDGKPVRDAKFNMREALAVVESIPILFQIVFRLDAPICAEIRIKMYFWGQKWSQNASFGHQRTFNKFSEI